MVTYNTRSSNNKSILIKHVIQSSHWLEKSKVYQKVRDNGYSYILCYILTEPASLPAKPIRYGECEGEGKSGKESDRNGELSEGRRVGRFE